MPELAPPTDLRDHRILIVNDDGIESAGIKLLEALAREISDDVWVVAPDEEKSGFSHSISLTAPIRVRQIDSRHYAVKGTPTDCALLAIHEFMGERKPTALLSGVNRGANLAEDITYSGTAAAAMEGALLGVRAIALSQVFTIGGEAHWSTARRYAPDILRQLLTCDWQPGSFVNVNFPDCPPDAVTGTRVTTQGRRLPGSFRPVRRIDERAVPYYWIKLAYEVGELEAGADLLAIAENAISITPMQMDLTAHAFRHDLDRTFRASA
ncbi:5'-nucleotidase /3'-nucleotidase /exopolyphosphatase [Roseiarcus fermentans]|uniref:5'-nucleotidase SurE n=1 Tax=Roseiarcus fermentans TaxID=1473586 RepID=A0A366FST1_9HYPH|nr:5'/3'-nucleotidase SurE [Roseiarcus fermentans]RBP17627.1 5'-nucleotidase /3'-nucleotidase /exopolyphosphatase [Roseiarcus fermentans]